MKTAIEAERDDDASPEVDFSSGERGRYALREAFHFAKLGLFGARLLARLEEGRESDLDVGRVVSEVARDLGIKEPVPLVNQATFLEVAYLTLVWLWEIAKVDHARRDLVLSGASERFGSLEAVLQTARGPRVLASLPDVLRLVRNAISHGHVRVLEERVVNGAVVEGWRFQFKDRDERREAEATRLTLAPEQLGELTDAIFFAMNDVLYPSDARHG